MQLPSHLQKFPEPTLIIATDTTQANFWLAGGDSLQELDGVAVPREREMDKEGQAIGATLEGVERAREAQFIKQVISAIEALFTQHHATSLRLAAPPEILHLLEGGLSKNIQERIKSRVPKDLLPLPPFETIERLLQP